MLQLGSPCTLSHVPSRRSGPSAPGEALHAGCPVLSCPPVALQMSFLLLPAGPVKLSLVPRGLRAEGGLLWLLSWCPRASGSDPSSTTCLLCDLGQMG